MTTTVFRAAGRRAAIGALALVPLVFAARASAQGPTAEGTVIVNTATATWTDANSNTYDAVTASASVTVGFAAGVDVVSAGSVSPTSPSVNDSLAFTVTNLGNGTDQVSVNVTAGAGVTLKAYRFNNVTYTTLASLNTALAATNTPSAGVVAIDVVYDVAIGQGGLTIPVRLTATSVRNTAVSDFSTTNVQPPVLNGVAVSPDGGSVQRLPSNGITYSETYAVTNDGNSSNTFTLTSMVTPGGAVTILTTNGAAGTAGGSITVAAGASQNVVVTYTVSNNAAAGTTEVIQLRATSALGAITDVGDIAVNVIRAAITMTKAPFRDNRTAPITSAEQVLPGEFIQYKITVTSAGGAPANTVRVNDPLPVQVVYDATTPDLATGWTITQASGTVTANLAGTLAAGESRFFWIRVKVK